MVDGRLFIAVCLGLLGAAVALAIVAFRARRRAAELRGDIARLEEEHSATLAEQVAARSQREEERLRREIQERRNEVDRRSREVESAQQELTRQRSRVEERAAEIDDRAQELTERANALETRAASIDQRESRLSQSEQVIRERLEAVAGLSAEEAKRQLMQRVETEIEGDIARLLQKADEAVRATADEKARAAVLQAMAALRGSVCGQGTVSLVTLPSDEMKGRVIGREGRNIRALEQATGVDLLVDDTPEAILLSTWDPLRRTIATRALRLLVEDGRIHPARIEEVVEKSRAEADEEAREFGEKAAFEVGVAGLHERLVLLLGRLSFFREQGSDLLQRAIEVGVIAGVIGDELRLDGPALRRAGLLHEIARADKSLLKAPIFLASADIAQRYGEKPSVTQPIRALAQPPDTPRTPLGVVLTTARRMALSRPGARNENLQRFMDRLSLAEEIALAKEGVEKAVAVRAGRELRVHVRADSFTDDRTILLARELAKEIEARVDYPGQIRVLVLRETRAVSYAV